MPQRRWVVEYYTFDIDLPARNVQVERLEICVERRYGRNLYQQFRRRIEEKPVIMMTLGLAFPNLMSHWSPLCVLCVSRILNIFRIRQLYSVVDLLFFYLIRLQGFDSCQIFFRFCISLSHCHSCKVHSSFTVMVTMSLLAVRMYEVT